MAPEKNQSDLSQNTLFIRGIPPSCSNETLQEVFSKAGAVKECFVVRYKNSKAESSRPCIGYVTFTVPDDAKIALRMEKEMSIDESKLKISFARKKKFSKKKGKKDISEEPEGADQNKSKPDSGGNVLESSEPPIIESNTTDLDDDFTVLVSGLPALYKKEHIITLWKKSGLKEPKEIIFPCDSFDQEEEKPGSKTDENEGKNLRQNAKFIVETKQAALKAYNKLAGKVVGKKKNYTLKVNFLTPEGNFKAARKSRLIVRNVSFQCSEDDLKKAFSSYGTITEVKIPLKPDGKKRGFAFVQFSHVFEATRAIEAMNMKEIKGRKVAIDWSLPKEKFKEMNAEEEAEVKVEETEHKEEDEPSRDSDSENTPDDGEADLSRDSGMEDDDESENNKETSEEDGSSDKDTTDGSDDEQESESDDEEENPYEKPMKKASSKPLKKLDPKSSHDIHEGRTVFVFNLSYDTTEEQLHAVLQEYGDICYTKIVLNRETGMSKGCGFVQFKTADEAKKCMESLSGDDSDTTIDGRQIKVTLALTRGDTEKMRKDGKKKIKEKEDKRNLYLGREGLVRPGTQAAEGLSAIELKKREKIENAKRAKLKNPNVFVSTTRLCIHNLPKSVDEPKLRELLLGLFKIRKGVRITECRIMRDRSNVNENGIGRPLGFAFVNFAQHENALKALRSFNNNPEIFGPIKRPIVEFALENRKALEIKEQRKKKFLSKQKLRENIRNDGGKNTQEKLKKLGRRKRQLLKQRFERGEEAEAGGKRRKIEKGGNASLSRVPKVKKFRRKGGEDAVLPQGPKDKKIVPRVKQERLEPSESASTALEERKPFQGSRGTSMSGKKLPLPTHSRPKIRAKNKGRILEQMRKSKKLNSKTEQRKVMEKFQRDRGQKVGDFHKKRPKPETEPRQKPPKRNRDSKQDKDFNALVAKYTKTFLEKSSAKKSGEKWYE